MQNQADHLLSYWHRQGFGWSLLIFRLFGTQQHLAAPGLKQRLDQAFDGGPQISPLYWHPGFTKRGGGRVDYAGIAEVTSLGENRLSIEAETPEDLQKTQTRLVGIFDQKGASIVESPSSLPSFSPNPSGYEIQSQSQPQPD